LEKWLINLNPTTSTCLFMWVENAT
jgi:hypothetical protein